MRRGPRGSRAVLPRFPHSKTCRSSRSASPGRPGHRQGRTKPPLTWSLGDWYPVAILFSWESNFQSPQSCGRRRECEAQAQVCPQPPNPGPGDLCRCPPAQSVVNRSQDRDHGPSRLLNPGSDRDRRSWKLMKCTHSIAKQSVSMSWGY